MEDVPFDGSTITVAPGATGRRHVCMLLDVEIVDGKIASIAPAGDYHFVDLGPRLPGHLEYYFRSPSDRDKCPNWPNAEPAAAA